MQWDSGFNKGLLIYKLTSSPEGEDVHSLMGQ